MASDTSLELLTTAEVAELLRVAPSTVIRWVESGKLPGIRAGAGAHWRFRRDDIEVLLTPVTPDEATA